MSGIFHNWMYAGRVVSVQNKIVPKTIRGNWEPIVTTEEFERGLEILERRSAIDQEETRTIRLLAAGKVTEGVRLPNDTCLIRGDF